jgi:hypothetical protein
VKRQVMIWLLAGALLGAILSFWLIGSADRQVAPATAQNGKAAASSFAASPAARPGATPVRLAPGLPGSGPGPVENDPRAPGYDPRRLVMIGKKVDDVILAEPRIEGWARPRERQLEDQVTADLAQVVPEARLEKTECHASSCVLTVSAPETKADQTMFALTLVGRSDTMSVRATTGQEGRSTHQLIVLFGPDLRPPGAYEAWYRTEREKTLAFLRKTPEAMARFKDVALPER